MSKRTWQHFSLRRSFIGRSGHHKRSHYQEARLWKRKRMNQGNQPQRSPCQTGGRQKLRRSSDRGSAISTECCRLIGRRDWRKHVYVYDGHGDDFRTSTQERAGSSSVNRVCVTQSYSDGRHRAIFGAHAARHSIDLLGSHL